LNSSTVQEPEINHSRPTLAAVFYSYPLYLPAISLLMELAHIPIDQAFIGIWKSKALFLQKIHSFLTEDKTVSTLPSPFCTENSD
jgi:hypothetical protein